MADTRTAEFGFAEITQKVPGGGSRKLRILHQKWVKQNGQSYWRQVGTVPDLELKNIKLETEPMS